MQSAIIVLLLLSTPFVGHAENASIDPRAAIQAEGSITITDGASFYRFHKDGTFQSGPSKGISGRTIKGTWKRSTDRPNNSFVVVGQWSWVNGISSNEDFRTMVLDVRPGTFRDRHPQESREMDERVFECYFLVDELRPVPKPAS